ncbi:MAG: Nramp family divalent metal transporter [Blastomonas sp.]
MVPGKALGMVMQRSWRPGPAMLVTAAFIGPGTVTACSMAGLNFGYGLLWALAFATFATIILQLLAARVALATGKGLAESMMSAAPGKASRWLMAILILLALAMGNAAYEAGNLLGANLGLSLALPGAQDNGLRLIGTGLAAGILVLLGRPKWLEILLILLVLGMTATFVGALFLLPVDWSSALAGLVPALPENGLFTAIALIGTTIVPYNLFLHAASVKGRFAADAEGIAAARMDTIVAVATGGLLSMAILLVGAALANGGSAGGNALGDIAGGLKQGFGQPASTAFALGLLGAGFSSALTAPLATGYVVAEIVAPDDPTRHSLIFKATALAVIAIGTLSASLALDATAAILVAQTANGLLLPVVATFLLWIAFKRLSLSPLARVSAIMVLLVCFLLGARLILRAIGVWP